MSLLASRAVVWFGGFPARAVHAVVWASVNREGDREMKSLMTWMGVVVAVLAIPVGAQSGEQGWISLFDGQSLEGWKAGENAGTFSVQEGAIVAHGPFSHLFYVGPICYGDFKDFELKVDVRTEPQANGGVFFHTQYQEKGLVAKGFEVQVNNSDRTDPLRTGSLYKMQNLTEAPAQDQEWFTMHVVVEGKHVTVAVGGRKLVDWTEPNPPQPPSDRPGRVLGSGTFALQGHDERSTVYYKNIYVKPLFPLVDYHAHLKGGMTVDDLIAISQRHAVKLGVAENCGVGFPTNNDEGLNRALPKLEGKPVYRALPAEGREGVKMFSPELIAQFDYVFTVSVTWTNH